MFDRKKFIILAQQNNKMGGKFLILVEKKTGKEYLCSFNHLGEENLRPLLDSNGKIKVDKNLISKK